METPNLLTVTLHLALYVLPHIPALYLLIKIFTIDGIQIEFFVVLLISMYYLF